MSAPVDDHRAFPAQRFRCERRGIRADVDGGGVKLHEFGVGDQRSRARRHGDAGAAGVDGVCRDAIEMADAAGREHKRGAAEEARLSVGVAAKHADRPAFPRYDFKCRNALDDFDRRRLSHPSRESLHDRAAGGVAFHPHDAAMRVRRLARGLQDAERVAIEGRAVA